MNGGWGVVGDGSGDRGGSGFRGRIPKADGGPALGRGTWQHLAANLALGEGPLFRSVRRFSLAEKVISNMRANRLEKSRPMT